MNKKYNFIIRPYENEVQKKRAEKLAMESDVVIFGSGDEKYLKIRLKENKLVFRYSERLFKGKMTLKRWIRGYVGTYIHYTRFLKYPFYILCASAYTAADVNKFFDFKDRVFKWGYFPEIKKYNIDILFDKKKSKSIIWVGRLIDWKHPEIPVKIADKLRNECVDFEMKIIGNGIMENKIRKLIKVKGLEDNVKMLGSMSPDKVREYMEKSQIFIFTSDSNEGWGAVLNEAMNSGCACVASHAIGSAPYLIKDGENGYLYKNGKIEDLYKKIVVLLKNDEVRKSFGKKAYETVSTEWNAKSAAKRVLILSEQIMNSGNREIFENGPCSRAEIISHKWFSE